MSASGNNSFYLDSKITYDGLSGIAGWDSKRTDSLKKFSRNKGLEWTELKTQLDYIIYELDGFGDDENDYYAKNVMERGGLKNLVVGNNDEENRQAAALAAQIWDDYYGIAAGVNAGNRQENALRIFADYGLRIIENDSQLPKIYQFTTVDCPKSSGSGGVGEDSMSFGDGEVSFPLAIRAGDITTKGSAWEHTYHESACTYYYALDLMINMKRGIEHTVKVIAMHDGTVVKANFGGVKGYGNMITIHDSAGLNWTTQHVDRVEVKKGQAVQQGAHIGTGAVNANGYHVHVDLSKGSRRPTACASCSPKICPAQGTFLKELRPRLKEIYESMAGSS
jgi:hypothetical protein